MEESKKENFNITNNTNGTPPISGVPLLDIKNKVLTNKYVLSLVFVDDSKSQELNKKYRKKDNPTNVLSFPLDENEGEIFINLDSVHDEHKDFERTPEKFLGYLFIHALFHLKGLDHGSRMESEEQKIRQEFEI